MQRCMLKARMPNAVHARAMVCLQGSVVLDKTLQHDMIMRSVQVTASSMRLG